jgi:hypothetical protein
VKTQVRIISTVSLIQRNSTDGEAFERVLSPPQFGGETSPVS